jgi:pyruvate/2-oxoglutarate dehydrogenase complex dihydrolipoamide acyltransferase (E2) component
MASIRIVSPLAGSIVQVAVENGQRVTGGALVAVVESMKMEHEVRAATDGVVEAVRCGVADVVAAGDVLALLRPVDAQAPPPRARDHVDSAALRADLVELRAREALLADASRPDAIARRHALGLRTARENIADLCDAGSFVEYGGLAFAAQRRRRELDDLLRNTPADGMVTGIGSVNGATFGAERARAVVLAYDATVLARTQGMRNHQKTDRLLAVAHRQRLPVGCSPKAAAAGPATSTCPSSPACMSRPSRAWRA